MSQSRTTKVLALSSGQALTKIISIIASAVLARMLTLHDYATYRQTMLAYAFVAPLLTLSLPVALYYFMPQNQGKERQILFENVLLLTMMGIVFTVFFICGGEKLLAMRFSNPDLESTLRILAPYSIAIFPAQAISACLIVRNRITLLTFYNVLSRFVLLVSIIGACIFFKTPDSLVMTEVVVGFLILIPSLLIMFSSCSGKVGMPDRQRIIAMIKYSVPVGLSTMLGTITLQLDKMIVSSMCSPDEFAIYVNGAVEIPLIGIITGSMATVILHDMTKMCQQSQTEKALMLFHTAAIRSASILFPVACFLMATADQFIIILFSEKYLESVVPFRLYLFVLPLRIVFYSAAIMAMGKTNQILFRSILELVINAVLSIILVKYIGYMGAVIATILTIYFWSVPFNLRIIAKGFGTHFFSTLPFRRLGSIAICSLVFIPCAFFYYFFHISHPAIQFCFSAVFYWIPTLLTLYRFGYISLPQRFGEVFRNLKLRVG